jgi:hypothetical protein
MDRGWLGMRYWLFGKARVKFQGVAAHTVGFIPDRQGVCPLLIETMTALAVQLFKALWAGQIWLEMNGVIELYVTRVAQLGGVTEPNSQRSRLAVLLTFLLIVLLMVLLIIWGQADCKLRMATGKTSNLTDKRRSSFGTIFKVGMTVGTKLFA